ncbi:MAG TPA: PAS domain-containing sensor histidine kinase [Candidatus Saccharimonadales bacterium]|nr:PAS domain-containing sensor histidine kinase [Candidatus Saccharimonadales bacterium]
MPSELKAELKELKARFAELEETLNAIRSGEVDALVAAGPGGDQIFTLQGAETPYRILVEEMSQGALMLIPDGTILYANTRFATLAKTSLEQVIGSSWQKFFPRDYLQLAACLETVEPVRPPEELSLRAADGSFCPVHLSLRSMSNNGVTGFSVIVTDLTEQKRSENALRKTSDELREKNGQLEAFSYSVSHDIRAPLRAMQGFATILLEDYADKLEPKPKSYLEIIASSANQLDRLIHDVLADSKLSRAQNGAASFDLDKMVREMVETYPNFREANIEVVASSAHVRGYEVALGQCISNLLCNAIKFVPAGRIPCVKVWTEPSNGHVRLWVQDNGIGILPHDQGRIFDIFSRVKTKGTYEGNGIGLNMVKKAVEKMGGRVGVESEPGRGSRFWIELESA